MPIWKIGVQGRAAPIQTNHRQSFLLQCRRQFPETCEVKVWLEVDVQIRAVDVDSHALARDLYLN